MRYLAVAFIATIGLGACTEPGRQVLAPTAATNCRDATLIAVDTIIDYSPRPGAFPALLTRSAPRLPKAAVPPNSARVITMSFVIDTSGYVIGPSVQIETAPWPEGDQVVCDWLRRAQFEPVRRGGRAAVDP
jgi:hypothetical protein